MDRDKLKSIVIAAVADVTGHPESEITETSHLSSDLGADSIDMVEIVINIEEKTSLSIPNERWMYTIEDTTVGEMINYLEKMER